MNEVYIFDIDGCIMPPIISNFDENGEPREKLVNEAKNIGRKIKLFSNFIYFCIFLGALIHAIRQNFKK